MKRKVWIVLSLLLVCSLLPVSALADNWFGDTVVHITSRSRVNVYREPVKSNQYYMGEAMPDCSYAYAGTKGEWHCLWFNSEEMGYVPAKYSEVRTGYVWLDSDLQISAVVLNTHSNALNIRSGPHIETRVLGELPSGAALPCAGVEGGWNCVAYEGGYGYIAGNRSAVVTGSLYPIEVISDTVAGATH